MIEEEFLKGGRIIFYVGLVLLQNYIVPSNFKQSFASNSLHWIIGSCLFRPLRMKRFSLKGNKKFIKLKQILWNMLPPHCYTCMLTRNLDSDFAPLKSAGNACITRWLWLKKKKKNFFILCGNNIFDLNNSGFCPQIHWFLLGAVRQEVQIRDLLNLETRLIQWR